MRFLGPRSLLFGARAPWLGCRLGPGRVSSNAPLGAGECTDGDFIGLYEDIRLQGQVYMGRRLVSASKPRRSKHLHMYVCMYVYIHVCICICIYVHINIDTDMYMCILGVPNTIPMVALGAFYHLCKYLDPQGPAPNLATWNALKLQASNVQRVSLCFP